MVPRVRTVLLLLCLFLVAATAAMPSESSPRPGAVFFGPSRRCHVAYTSTQSNYALAFLAHHPETRLVTIMLGANDLSLFQNACAGDPTCIANGLPQLLATVSANIGTILGEIRGTGYRGVIVVANYYSLDYSNCLLYTSDAADE